MNKLLEILGRAITVDTADLIWHWLDTVRNQQQNNKTPASKRLDEIIKLMGDACYQKADELLRLYLFENPSCIQGRLAAAAISLRKNQLQIAIEELNSVYMRQPNNTMALYALGHCYERLGKEAQAVEFYQDCLKFKNYLQLPRQRLAAIYFKNSQLEKTIAEYEILRSEFPDDISTLLTLGYLYIACKKYDLAIETFNVAILIHPDNFNMEFEEIDELLADGQLDLALREIDQKLENEPDRPDLLLKHADILTKIGADDETVLQYQHVLELCPDFLEATIKLGTQYLQMHQLELAARQFNRAVDINDKVVDAYIGLAMAQKLAGRPSEARSILSLAAAIQPNSSLLFSETATLQFRVMMANNKPFDDFESSPELFEAVINAHREQLKQRPNNPDLLYRLGVLMMSVNRSTEAVKAFKKVLKLNPEYTRAKSKLIVSLFEVGREEQAVAELVAAEPITKDSLELHYKTAMLYCDKVRFASSLINLEQYMEDNFASADTTINISIVLQNLGMLDKAAAMWENLSDTTNNALNTEQLFPPATEF